MNTIFQKRKPFIGYVLGGDVEYTVECALALVQGGVDILEIGLPYSDPVADGPTIAKAHEKALRQGATSATLLEIGRRLRLSTDIPMILMSYLNPLLKKGETYLYQLKQSGFDAVLTVDLPLPSPEGEPLYRYLKTANLSPILLAAPTTTPERLAQMAPYVEGFLYYACQKGTTGIRTSLAEDFSEQIEKIRKTIPHPIAAGFGIADRQSAKAALQAADGFIVGSAFVKLMEEKCPPIELKQLAEAIDPR